MEAGKQASQAVRMDVKTMSRGRVPILKKACAQSRVLVADLGGRSRSPRDVVRDHFVTSLG